MRKTVSLCLKPDSNACVIHLLPSKYALERFSRRLSSADNRYRELQKGVVDSLSNELQKRMGKQRLPLAAGQEAAAQGGGEQFVVV